jgi:putative aminopeptidase FrvX
MELYASLRIPQCIQANSEVFSQTTERIHKRGNIMNRDQLLRIVEPVLYCPTAPTFEAAVADEICRQLRGRTGIQIEKDQFGNLIVARSGSASARFAFVAHMDHPGWRLHPNKEFLGGISPNLRDAGKIRSFGEFGMWDLPELVVQGERLYSRACDDLIGCCAIVGLLRSLEASRSPASVLGVFTRAEEVGFIGAIELAKARRLDPEVTVISLETSAERPPAQMGAGPIIRVGDRTSIFDSDVTAFLVETAKSKNLSYQRCLMDGGTCEATAFQLYGYRSAALSIALGNYHNCTPDSHIDAEYVDLKDLEGLIDLCVSIVTEPRSVADTREALRGRLEARLKDFPLG